tara:strand:- start:439 stop:888 length:450 start_codon:yes stop_codon:yes gene_type:complete
MAYIKGRYLNPERGEGYHGSFLGIAGENLSENEIVISMGYSGDQIKFSLADSNAAGLRAGVMGVVKHDAASGETVVILSHKLVTGVDTDSSSGVGYPVFLSQTPGAWQVAEGDGVVVGSVLADHASTGAVLLAPSKVQMAFDVDGDPVP